MKEFKEVEQKQPAKIIRFGERVDYSWDPVPLEDSPLVFGEAVAPDFWLATPRKQPAT